MDKSWMQLPNKYWPEYRKGIWDFIEIAKKYPDRVNRTRCPCNNCNNRIRKHINEVRVDLLDYGMDKNYTRWVHHGEDHEVVIDDNSGDKMGCHGMEEILEDLKASTVPHDSCTLNVGEGEGISDHCPNTNKENSEVFDKLLSEMQQPLYPGCDKFSKLDFLVKLFHLKIINRWSNKSFDMNLQLIKAALPAGETLPKSHYECKAIMRNLGFGYISIHACKNDSVLFWKEHAKLENCPQCNEPRYKSLEGKGKKIPDKVLRYFPLKPKLQRLFMSRMTAMEAKFNNFISQSRDDN